MENVLYIPSNARHVLVVHPDIGALTVFQKKFRDAGLTPILARDLPTALLAIAQHRLAVCVLASRIAEENDGWALAAVLHMCFPTAFVGVIAPQVDILSYQAAINSGTAEVYAASANLAEVADSIVHDLNARMQSSTSNRAHVQ